MPCFKDAWISLLHKTFFLAVYVQYNKTNVQSKSNETGVIYCIR